METSPPSPSANISAQPSLNTLEDQTRAYLASLAITSTSEQLDQGEKFYLLQQESPEAFNGLVASLATDSIVQASKIVALTEHYRRNLCKRSKTGESKLQPCALELIEVGNRDSSHVGDLPSLLGGHPSDGAHLSRSDHSEPRNANPIFHINAEDPDEPDSDEEPPELLSQSEDESDFWEEFEDSDSEDEVIIVNTTDTVANPIFNENEEGDDMDEEPFYEDEDHTVETNDYEELQHITELKATREGQTADQTVPRFNIESLRPFEVMFADEKSYDVTQRSG